MAVLKQFTIKVVYVIFTGSSSQCNNPLSDSWAKLAGFSKHLYSQTKSSVLCVGVMSFAVFSSLLAGIYFKHPHSTLCLCRKCKAYKEAWSIHVGVFLYVLSWVNVFPWKTLLRLYLNTILWYFSWDCFLFYTFLFAIYFLYSYLWDVLYVSFSEHLTLRSYLTEKRLFKHSHIDGNVRVSLDKN